MSQHPLQHKNIILGVTGSIAAYKAADLASKLAQSGANVNVVLTDAATKFIAPLTFQSVTGQPAYTDADLWGADAHVLHIGLARKADALLIAPATANTLAKLAHGQADDLICLTALALGSEANAAPLMIAPAMDAGMY
ncbi:MAG: bifunctional 4'-phosphopantothenoylcysteine decarboxylase/phosphopantothenoylcysteine synthetase, partial [Chloroflexi bacterium]|nr:bifunctional 4'-phosphopantothenoylcysteine decarboxylase/phosphopantothenoylcysteine synthetase [Chloroflexota bacterium]